MFQELFYCQPEYDENRKIIESLLKEIDLRIKISEKGALKLFDHFKK